MRRPIFNDRAHRHEESLPNRGPFREGRHPSRRSADAVPGAAADAGPDVISVPIGREAGCYGSRPRSPLGRSNDSINPLRRPAHRCATGHGHAATTASRRFPCSLGGSLRVLVLSDVISTRCCPRPRRTRRPWRPSPAVLPPQQVQSVQPASLRQPERPGRPGRLAQSWSARA